MRTIRVLQVEVNPTVTTVQVPIITIDEYGNSHTNYVPQRIETSVVVFPTGPYVEEYYVWGDR